MSGSGKSSLVNEILYKRLAAELNGATQPPGQAQGHWRAWSSWTRSSASTSRPIGRTPRSNPATYTGVFNDIREPVCRRPRRPRCAATGPGRFSFNVKGGRCEACEGDGILKIEMHFLPDIYVPCDVCKGSALQPGDAGGALQGQEHRRRAGHDGGGGAAILCEPAQDRTASCRRCCEVGLGYVKLGQPATTLSGGEAQRVKLATELSRRATGQTVYILDEPTTGLHAADVHKLIEVLQTAGGWRATP